MGACLSETELDRYHGGEMNDEQSGRVRHHLSECSQCAQRNAELLAGNDALLGRIHGWTPEEKKSAVEALPAERESSLGSGSGDARPNTPPSPHLSGGEPLNSPGEAESLHTQRLPMAHDLDVGAPPPDRGLVPGYDVIREIHRGGQGIVYQAIQKSTKRKVAIKVLLEGQYASRAAQKRFEREIELIANLKHPHIVSIFDSGVTPDGRQFCVMDYVAGVRLDQYVRERKIGMEDALKLFITISDAVNYAHQRGVIHRDLKPSNILVDSEGAPKVLDFGLAKRLSAPVDTLLSMSQHIVGTLPYMSPEQARGTTDEADIRSDVYSLGVVLYELLTGHYPYPVVGEMAEILRHITQTDPSPPDRAWEASVGIRAGDSVRLHRRDGCPIDDEVKTIVYKSLAKERERRYQSAGELARDIQRYLVGEPIEAKRDSGWYMMKKTLRRYRLAASVGVGFIALVCAFSVVMSFLYTRATAAETRAESRFQQVRQLANVFIFEFQPMIKKLAGSTPAQKLLVTTATKYLDNLSQEAGDDASLQQELAQAYLAVGDVKGGPEVANLGDTEGALQSYRRAEEILQKLSQEQPDNPQWLIESAVVKARIGVALMVSAGAAPALEEFLRAQELDRRALEMVPDNKVARRNLAAGYDTIGRVYARLGRNEESLEQHRKSLEIEEARAKQEPDNPDPQQGIASAQGSIGQRLIVLGREQEALPPLLKALEISEKLSAAHPDNAALRRELSLALDSVGRVLRNLGRKVEARAYLDRMLAIDAALAAEDPTNAGAQRDLAVSYQRLGDFDLSEEAHAVAGEKYAKAKEIFGVLAEHNAASMEAQADLAGAQMKIGRLHSLEKRWDEARQELEAAVAIQTKLSKVDAANMILKRDLAVAHDLLGEVYIGSGKLDAAREHFQTALDVVNRVAEGDPTNMQVRHNQTVALWKMGRVHQMLAERRLTHDDKWAELLTTSIDWMRRCRDVTSTLLESNGTLSKNGADTLKLIDANIAASEALLQNPTSQPAADRRSE